MEKTGYSRDGCDNKEELSIDIKKINNYIALVPLPRYKKKPQV